MEVQTVKPQQALRILHSVISERETKINPEARYFLYPDINNHIVASRPVHWIRFGLCVLKGFSMFLHNIHNKILLHLVPLSVFVLAVRTDCSLKGLSMFTQNIYKFGLHSRLTQTRIIILELQLLERIVKLWHHLEKSGRAVCCGS